LTICSKLFQLIDMQSALSQPTIDPEFLTDFAQTLINRAAQKGLRLRLMGGVAVRARCQRTREYILANRPYVADIDFYADVDQPLEIDRFLRATSMLISQNRRGFKGGEHWNYRYQISEVRVLNIDVYFGRLSFNHSFRPPYFSAADAYTLSITNLFLLKLGIEDFGPKDCLDSLAILAEHGLEKASDPEIIQLALLCRAWCDGWSGWCMARTCSKNLNHLGTQLTTESLPPDIVDTIRDKLDVLERLINRCRKTICWKTRNMIGDQILGMPIRYFSPVE
jgi:hypothetical protein